MINMAHGEFYALGAFISVLLGALGVPFWPLLVACSGADAAGRRYRGARADPARLPHPPDRHVTTLLLTFGLGLVLEDVFRLDLGPQSSRPETPVSGATEVVGLFLPLYRAFMIGIGALIIVGKRWSFTAHASARWCACGRLRPQHGGFAGVPVQLVYAGAFRLRRRARGRIAGVLLAPDLFGISDDGPRLTS